MDNFFTRYLIEDRSYVAFVKKEIRNNAIASGFSEFDTGRVDLVVAEITSNVIKHAGSGELLYRVLPNAEIGPTFEIICIDKGPGIRDIPHAMKDGNSTTKTMGGGLGSIERQSNTFQVMSMPGWGTVLYSRIITVPKGRTSVANGVEVRAMCVPKPHEDVSGDGYAVVHQGGYTKVLFGDGLGHGKQAAEAINTAKDIFCKLEDVDPVYILRRLHDGVRRTRGLVATVAVLDKHAGVWKICGVGNINTRIYTGIEYRTYMSYNGTIGMTVPTSLKATEVPVEKNQHLIMCSDGITTRWQLSKYSYIFKYDPLVVAGAIYKDFTRGNDDASVLIAKIN